MERMNVYSVSVLLLRDALNHEKSNADL